MIIIDENAVKWRATQIIANIKSIIQDSIKSGYLDRQWYLDFKDKLNELSVDEDRN